MSTVKEGMKVYKVMAYGFESTGLLIAANNFAEAYDIAVDAAMGSIDHDDIWELRELSTTQKEVGVIEQF